MGAEGRTITKSRLTEDECKRCGHPKSKTEKFCEHCKEAIDFTLHGRDIIEKNCLTSEQWSLSQKNEAWFWQTQKGQDNLEQRQRNDYYRNVLEDDCIISRDFFAQDFSESAIMDVGSGPEGILHVLKAKFKLAVDPLMPSYVKQGYDVGVNNVWWLAAAAEDFYPYTIPDNPVFFDYALCLNALDHMRDPAMAIKNIAKYLELGAELLLITDLRIKELLDVYHRLIVTEDDVMSWLEPYFGIVEKQLIRHGDGTLNIIKQLVIRCRKYS